MPMHFRHRRERVDNILAIVIIVLAAASVGYGLLTPVITSLPR